MAGHCLFLSYQRSALTTPAVERLSRQARVLLKSSAVEVFFDQRSIDAGTPWEPTIDAALARTTHFLAFVSVDYWLSPQCMRELDAAVSRYELTSAPKLLFVLADQLDPNDLALDSRAAASQMAAGANAAGPMRRVSSAGQINFLGPHNDAGRLVRLAFESPALLNDQLAALITRIKQLLRGEA